MSRQPLERNIGVGEDSKWCIEKKQVVRRYTYFRRDFGAR